MTAKCQELQAAKAASLKTYFTGKPCKHGHVAERKVSNRECVVCNKLSMPKGYLKDYYLKNKETQKACRKEYYENNKQAFLDRSRQARLEGKHKEWRQKNKGKMTALVRKREEAKRLRIPAWADLKAIGEFYANCPENMAVDHIIPLRGKLVSGLHVLSNLQYLTRSDNSKKNNKFDPLTHEEPICLQVCVS